ncbi:MAG: oligosaccharide flippase family protein, partial [Paracoccus sp. (in: a-proteobacteria)]|nr:oligosaccharide flippase family protein [Paracoccus sp. (in: a-proteobacteria)]
MRARSIRASAISAGGIFAQRGLSLVSNLVMTRLLVPEAFGLMAMVVLVHILVEMMSDIGISQSIIRSEQGDRPDYLRAAWSVQIVRSSVIALCVVLAGIGVFFLGPRLAAPNSVYADANLPWLIMVSAIAVLMRGFESTGMALAQRQLKLGKVVQIEIGNQIVVIILMILLAQWKATVWVLLAGMILGSVQRMIWTHLAFRGVPMRWSWNRDIAADMWTYGRWLILSSLAGFVVNQGDRLFLGAMLDKTTFGIYVIATLWMDVGQQLISKVAGQVAMSGFAETLRERRERFPIVFRKVQNAYNALAGATFVGAFFLGPVLIGLMYSADYQDAGWMLPLLAFRYLVRRQAPFGAFLLADGNSRAMSMSVVTTAILMCTLLPLFYWTFGLPATLVFVGLAPMAGLPVLYVAARRRMAALPFWSEILTDL